MTTFEQTGYDIERGVISKDAARLMAIEFQMLRDNYYYNNRIDQTNMFEKNDHQVKKSFCWYGPYCFESLLEYMKPKMEELTGTSLYTTYSYARIYYNGADMPVHLDRTSCQYSATITIEVDETGPWEIYMENYSGDAKPLSLDVGDICIYRGDKLKHWRTEYKGKKQIQAFLHYVDANGEYAGDKFDRRKFLGCERNVAAWNAETIKEWGLDNLI